MKINNSKQKHMNNCCNIFDVFDKENTLIKSYVYWDLCVRKKSVSLGNCVLISKQHAENASVISPEAWQEYGRIIGSLEQALTKLFQYKKINYLTLMMVDTHFHTHIIPRYDSDRVWMNKIWQDSSWPKPPELSNPEILDIATITSLKRAISQHL